MKATVWSEADSPPGGRAARTWPSSGRSPLQEPGSGSAWVERDSPTTVAVRRRGNEPDRPQLDGAAEDDCPSSYHSAAGVMKSRPFSPNTSSWILAKATR